MNMRADAGCERHHARLKRRHAEAHLKQQRQQKGPGSEAGAEEEAADDAGAVGRNREQLQDR